MRLDELDETSKIEIIRNSKREGLIRSRVFGARKATGDVLIFLDSHIEVNKQWIEPLLHLIKQNKSAVAVPIIDIINADTFAYSSSPLVRGGFNWGLHYRWDNIPKAQLTKPEHFVGPFASPTMAGGESLTCNLRCHFLLNRVRFFFSHPQVFLRSTVNISNKWANTTWAWTSGEARTLKFHSESGSVVDQFKLCLVVGSDMFSGSVDLTAPLDLMTR